MRIFYAPEISEEFELPEEEAAHCLRVLRMKDGDEIMLADGKGCFHKAVISASSSKRCWVRILESCRQESMWKGHLHIAVAPAKLMDRNEWLVEKAVEIGVDEITFLLTERSERDVMKMERIEKIAVSAMKQSVKSMLPVLNGMTTFAQFIGQCREQDRFIAHCEPGQDKLHLMNLIEPGHDVVVLIGPEGDFSPQEISLALQNGFRPVSLGSSRLRTETAAIVAVHLMNLKNTVN